MVGDMETMDAGTPRQLPHMLDEGSTDEGSAVEIVDTLVEEEEGEDALIHALGITMIESHGPEDHCVLQTVDEAVVYDVVPNPDAEAVDLSDLRGTRAPTSGTERLESMKDKETNDDLEALAELVPELKSRSRGTPCEGHTMTMDDAVVSPSQQENNCGDMKAPAREVQALISQENDEGVEVEVEKKDDEKHSPAHYVMGVRSLRPAATATSPYCTKPAAGPKNGLHEGQTHLEAQDSMQVHQSTDDDDQPPQKYDPDVDVLDIGAAAAKVLTDGASLPSSDKNKRERANTFENEDQNLGGFDDVDSDNALDSDEGNRLGDDIRGVHADKTAEKYPAITSSASLSTATQTHEVRMPMYLPTFKPATGCTNASDFIVRCFVARLRSGITVVKHGRSRWCKSRLRILHIHPDGRSLSWKPALGEPATNKRPPKLDLSTCMEVRHAWSPDPLNPMFTGTTILRQKCEAANAHKSFALIFPRRTVDITAVTADQCKVLMEGFSALCFRLQVANLAGRGSKKGKDGSGDEEEVATTASITLTNNSTQLSPSGSGSGARSKRNAKRNH